MTNRATSVGHRVSVVKSLAMVVRRSCMVCHAGPSGCCPTMSAINSMKAGSVKESNAMVALSVRRQMAVPADPKASCASRATIARACAKSS